MNKPTRSNHIAAIHVVRATLVKAGVMTEDDYRALACTVTGEDSSARMSVEQRQRFLAHLRALELKHGLAKPRVVAPRARHPQDGKALALWGALHALGAVRDGRPAALNAYAQRQTRVARIEWLDDAQMTTLIESLKKWVRRVEVAAAAPGAPEAA